MQTIMLLSRKPAIITLKPRHLQQAQTRRQDPPEVDQAGATSARCAQLGRQAPQF
jgi:hypothetical protein